MKLNKCGIYQIRNLITNDLYIGQSINLDNRKINHFWKLRNVLHYNLHLQNAFNKYGEENFIFEILLYCEPNELTYYEQALVDKWKPSYNILTECVDSPKGTIASDETRKKQSIIRIGTHVSDETKLKMSLSKKGKLKSEETKLRMSLAQSGRCVSEETKKKSSESHKGIKLTLESILKREQTKRNNPRQKLVRSEETKRKLSELRRLYWKNKREESNRAGLGLSNGIRYNDEIKKKMSESAKNRWRKINS